MQSWGDIGKITSRLIALSALFLAGCKNSSSDLRITGAWGRASPESAVSGAIYLKIENNGKEDDVLLNASSPACGSIEIHETVMEGDVMSMHPLPDNRLLIPAGETVELKTGSMHLMCIQKTEDFQVGKKIPIKLAFEQTGEMNLEIEIRNP